jgi:hypothetical protein
MQTNSSVRYEKETGMFFNNVGERIDKTYSNGYSYVCFNGVWHSAHRLAWYIVTGKFPENEIDHINNCRSDNRFSNLREATKSQNQANGNCGKGYSKNGNKWKAAIKVNGKQIHLGTFQTKEEAASAYLAARHKHFKEFAADNR